MVWCQYGIQTWVCISIASFIWQNGGRQLTRQCEIDAEKKIIFLSFNKFVSTISLKIKHKRLIIQWKCHTNSGELVIFMDSICTVELEIDDSECAECPKPHQETKSKADWNQALNAFSDYMKHAHFTLSMEDVVIVDNWKYKIKNEKEGQKNKGLNRMKPVLKFKRKSQFSYMRANDLYNFLIMLSIVSSYYRICPCKYK